MSKIHPTAIIESGAQIGEDVEIGPYCVIGANVKIGARSRLISHVNISGYTEIGEENEIYPFASLGTAPQDHAWNKEIKSYLKIGHKNVFREGFMGNPGTGEGTETIIGNNCYMMANSHVAHNCKVGNDVIMVNGSMIAGYVEVGDKSLLSGLSAVHQFCRVGTLSVISGCSAISMDLPPYMIVSGRNGAVRSVNLVGLRRSNFGREKIKMITDLYQIFFKQNLSVPNAVKKAREELPPSSELEVFLNFCETAKRGILSGYSHL